MARKIVVNRILAVIQQEGAKNNPSELLLGEVISQNPISIKFGELPLNRDDLFINKTLITDNSFNCLPGATVILYPVMDNQKYLVLCEVI